MFFSQSVNKQLFVNPLYDGNKSLWKMTPLFTLNGYLASCYMYLWASAVANTYLENIDFAKATDAEIRVFGEKLKQTLYANAHGGDAMAALKQATGRELPNFASFAQSFL